MNVALLAGLLLNPTPKSPPMLIALNKGDNTAWIINMDDGKKLASLSVGPNPNEVAVSPDNKWAAISNMGSSAQAPGTTLSMINLSRLAVDRNVSVAPNSMPHGITWLSPTRLVFTSHTTDSLNELDTENGKVLRTLPTEQKGTHLAVFDKGFKNAYAVSAFSGTITAFDFVSGAIKKQIASGTRAEGISLSADGKWIACGNLTENTVSIIDTSTLEVTKKIDKIGGPIRTFFTRDGKHLAVSSLESGSLEIFKTDGWSKVTSVDLKQKPIANPQYGKQWPAPMNFAMRKNGNLLVVLFTSHAVAEIDPTTWKVVKSYDTGPVPDGIAVVEP